MNRGDYINKIVYDYLKPMKDLVDNLTIQTYYDEKNYPVLVYILDDEQRSFERDESGSILLSNIRQGIYIYIVDKIQITDEISQEQITKCNDITDKIDALLTNAGNDTYYNDEQKIIFKYFDITKVGKLYPSPTNQIFENHFTGEINYAIFY